MFHPLLRISYGDERVECATPPFETNGRLLGCPTWARSKSSGEAQKLYAEAAKITHGEERLIVILRAIEVIQLDGADTVNGV